jgi:peptidoglycan/xylan/chitin deacetylase (PgdA/CDA1 family)
MRLAASLTTSVAALLTTLCLPTSILAQDAPAADTARQKQLVMISFDGAGSNALWQRSRDFARQNNAHFTYFLSCSLVIPRADRTRYEGPGKKAGRSNIGFAQDRPEAKDRLGHIWQAHEEGHDISSHTCGHFDGKDWSAADWTAEFTSFHDIMTNAWTAIGAGDAEPKGWRDFIDNDIRGFRAPYFSTSDGLVTAEKKAGFTYDASLVTKGPMLPERKGDLIRFGLPLIPEGPSQRPIIAMDYNLFIRHSAGVDNPSRSAEFEERAYSAFRAAFDKQYDGERIPLQIGLHFVEMNAGAYWRAMERLASDVCNRSDVACVSYTEAIRMLDERPGKVHSSTESKNSAG